jgi:hypothetical protein
MHQNVNLELATSLLITLATQECGLMLQAMLIAERVTMELP